MFTILGEYRMTIYPCFKIHGLEIYDPSYKLEEKIRNALGEFAILNNCTMYYCIDRVVLSIPIPNVLGLTIDTNLSGDQIGLVKDLVEQTLAPIIGSFYMCLTSPINSTDLSELVKDLEGDELNVNAVFGAFAGTDTVNDELPLPDECLKKHFFRNPSLQGNPKQHFHMKSIITSTDGDRGVIPEVFNGDDNEVGESPSFVLWLEDQAVKRRGLKLRKDFPVIKPIIDNVNKRISIPYHMLLGFLRHECATALVENNGYYYLEACKLVETIANSDYCYDYIYDMLLNVIRKNNITTLISNRKYNVTSIIKPDLSIPGSSINDVLRHMDNVKKTPINNHPQLAILFTQIVIPGVVVDRPLCVWGTKEPVVITDAYVIKGYELHITVNDSLTFTVDLTSIADATPVDSFTNHFENFEIVSNGLTWGIVFLSTRNLLGVGKQFKQVLPSNPEEGKPSFKLAAGFKDSLDTCDGVFIKDALESYGGYGLSNTALELIADSIDDYLNNIYGSDPIDTISTEFKNVLDGGSEGEFISALHELGKDIPTKTIVMLKNILEEFIAGRHDELVE